GDRRNPYPIVMIRIEIVRVKLVIGSDEQIVCLKRYLNRHTSSRNIVVFRDIGSHATKHSILRHKRSCSGINGIRHAVQRTEIKENSAAAEDPKIGRASCRERRKTTVVTQSFTI